MFAVLGLLAILSPSASQAFQLGEHRTITRQAIDEYNLCASGLLGQTYAETVVSGNINEDLDLFRKWTSYSHFYHPTKTLTQRRMDSSISIIEIEYEVGQLLNRRSPELGDAYKALGHAIHHLQDAASPPHVVPVMHGLTDGFEGLELTIDETPDFDLSITRCAAYERRARTDGLLSILDDTATATLAAVKTAFSVVKDGRPASITWEAFWKEADGPEFGTPGFLGETFGDNEIVVNGNRYVISRATYAAFKKARLRVAMDATRRALHWFGAQEWGTQ